MENENFRPEAMNLWKSVHDNFEVDAEAHEILRTACRCYSRYLDADDVLSVEGVFFTSEGGLKRKHPAVEVMKISHAGFLSAMRRLNLDWQPDTKHRGPGRPPGR